MGPLPRLLTALLFACAALLLTLAAACSDPIPAPQTPTPRRSPSPGASATPAFPGKGDGWEYGLAGAPTPRLPPDPPYASLPAMLSGIDMIPLEMAPQVELPQDVSLLVCGPCGPPQPSLYRAYHARAGIRVEPVFAPREAPSGPYLDWRLGLSQGLDAGTGTVRGIVAGEDGGEIVAALCSGLCPPFPARAPNLRGEERTALWRSTDGGVTWGGFGELEAGQTLEALLAPGALLISTVDGDGVRRFSLFPSGEAVPVPEYEAPLRPVILSDGSLLWFDEEGDVLLTADGRVFLSGAGGSAFVELEPHLPLRPPGGERRGILSVWLSGPGTSFHYFLAELRPDGAPIRAYVSPVAIRPAAWLDYGRLLAVIAPPGTPAGSAWQPAVVDLRGRRIQPLTLRLPLSDFSALLPGAKVYAGAGSSVLGAARGSFLRVQGTDLCLNVYAAPDPGAGVLDCAAEGALVRPGIGNAEFPGGVYRVNGSTWLSVITPSGLEGFADAAYLRH